ncbi:MAG: radical SAM protein [Chitinophagaceae bacterium]|nr:radical SAM protein [Chitinophagaceae bacterium]
MHTLVQDRPGVSSKKITSSSPVNNTSSYQIPVFITGFKQRVIRKLIWLNILIIALRLYRQPFTALKKVKALKELRNRYRNQQPLPKYIQSGKRYFVNFNTPGWPSAAFNRYAKHFLDRINNEQADSIYTLVFAITKKCGFQCEHCCEWLNLNKPETLSKEDLLLITRRFHELGISQVQLSGGEPLNRLEDIIYLLDNAPGGIDFWLYTTGYSLTPGKAVLLKNHGLTGITISLDHYIPEKHNAFRGVRDAFEKALAAIKYAREAGLVTCFSLCATKEFITEENLTNYMDLARQTRVSFIQVLEPKAVGHYAGKDVTIAVHHQKMLEHFFETFNYDPAYAQYPAIAYHGYTSRRFGCAGSGTDYVYADTDGDIHNCPFCQQKLFSAFDNSLPDLIRQMKTKGCNAFPSCSVKK